MVGVQSERAIHVLVADDDPSASRLMGTALSTRAEIRCTFATDGREALQMALSEPRPDLIVLDWMMPGMTGLQVCRLVRAERPDVPILMVTARGRRDELLQCLGAGATDALPKPIAPDLLAAKVMRAIRASAVAAPGQRLREALCEARDHGHGELVVRQDHITARVFFHAGAVAWLEVADGSPSFLRSLVANDDLDMDTARDLVEECRRIGAPLGEVLEAWTLLVPEELRAKTLAWMRARLLGLFQMTQPRCLFLPEKRAYSGQLFALDELLPQDVAVELAGASVRAAGVGSGFDADVEMSVAAAEAPRLSLIPLATTPWEDAFALAPATHTGVEQALERCMLSEGFLGVAAFDRRSGYCLGRRGEQLDTDIVWAHIQALNTVMRLEPVLDSVVATKTRFHLVRIMEKDRGVFLYALADAGKVRLAMARMALEQAVAE